MIISCSSNIVSTRQAIATGSFLAADVKEMNLRRIAFRERCSRK
jgi:hypothetical protein